MSRIYHHLAPSGEERLRELIQEYEDVTEGIFQTIREEGGTNGQS